MTYLLASLNRSEVAQSQDVDKLSSITDFNSKVITAIPIKNIKKMIAVIKYNTSMHLISFQPPINAHNEVPIKTIPIINKIIDN